ncbi:MAG: alpha/beta hydrolase [Candidatus Chryseobacterium colombiense]|nr:alpha/beta hydrolase [Chryseobacterium sp.]WEK71189.1 MAG: alpha/beta hydrolase [Chryseobacterium sp.]
MKQSVIFRNGEIEMAGNLFLPSDFNPTQKYPAIVVGHPAGGVKEQTAGIYASKMAEKGFVTLAFDASYQGESGGLPRNTENPSARVGDISAAVDFLTTLAYVDAERIGGIGICASGGYFVAATKQEKRIKALATVSGVDIGQMYHKGWNGKGGTVNIQETLEAVANQRTAEASGAEPVYMNWVGERHPEYGKEATDGYDYYRTARAQHPNSTGVFLLTDLSRLINFRAFDRIETLLTQPLLVIAGREANSKWNSDFLYVYAASKNKEYFIVDEANHFDLYDIPQYVDQAIERSTQFFSENL